MSEDTTFVKWEVQLHRTVKKSKHVLPAAQCSLFESLVDDLQRWGPVQGSWPNYSKLGKDLHHCHLGPKWVACWEVKNKRIRLLEVYYLGSRKDAPY